MATILQIGLLGSCTVLKSPLQEGQVTGTYSAVTDFSRDIQNMNGAKETVVYKNGREETLKFLTGHKFIKTIHYTSDRVADQIVMGSWELLSHQIIHAFGYETMTSFSEFYKVENQAHNLIRLDEHQQKLASEYAPYFTYYRQKDPTSKTEVN